MSVKKDLAEPSNVQYIYDGSFPGFLCCVYESVYSKSIPLNIEQVQDLNPTFFERIYIKTDPDKADRVFESIQAKLSSRSQKLVKTVFLTCMEDKELKMLKYLLFGYITGRSIDNMLGHEYVAPLLKAEQQLLRECHLLSGFIRFSDDDGFLTSTITPKNFVLPHLAKHFTERYNSENFVIFDKTNKHALIYQEGKAEIIQTEMIRFREPSSQELKYRTLWKQFYETIAIQARINPKCRMTHMPKRYWENMVEMEDKV